MIVSPPFRDPNDHLAPVSGTQTVIGVIALFVAMYFIIYFLIKKL